ncbi:MAG: hypothetical protein WC969_09730 [Elusimicrobiota bacterium]|jgi:hypothetical protein
MTRPVALALVLALLAQPGSAAFVAPTPVPVAGTVLPAAGVSAAVPLTAPLVPGTILENPAPDLGLLPAAGVLPAVQPAQSADAAKAPPRIEAAVSPVPAAAAAKPASRRGKRKAAAASSAESPAPATSAGASDPGLPSEGEAPQSAGETLTLLDPAADGAALFDGASARPAGSAELPAEFAEQPAETFDLRFSRDAKKALTDSELTASIRLVNGSGSQWYWERFVPGSILRIMTGGKTMFATRVMDARTVEIGKLAREDFQGVYPAAMLEELNEKGRMKWTAAKLRAKLLEDLTAYQRFGKRGAPRALSSSDKVRVLRFMSYQEAKLLPENRDEPVLTPRLRAPLEIPASLSSLPRVLPKVVFLDLRLLSAPLSYDLIEDIGKLMKAGVYFVLVSERPQEGPGSVKELLTGALTPRQRDDLVTYKLLSLSDDGSTLSTLKGAFPQELPLRRFSVSELDLLELAARRLGASVLSLHGKESSFALRAGALAADFTRDLRAALGRLGVDAGAWSFAYSEREGKTTLVLRPRSLAGAVPEVLDALRESEGTYVNASDLLVVSRDAELLAATRGAVQPSEHAPALEGAALIETSLAAMLGDYRQNVPGDLAASASKISAFLQGYKDSGGSRGNVYMLMGHVIHSSFNWAVWIYRNTGALPPAEAVVERAVKTWQHEDRERVGNILDEPGSSMADYLQVTKTRLRNMHAQLADQLAQYPIVVGTELPNFAVLGRAKKSRGGMLYYRDVLRYVFDLVLARRTPEGLELRVVDFKTGQTPTLQNLTKDTQVLLYDALPRSAWPELPLPYGVGGTPEKVSKLDVAFIFPTATYVPAITDWGRLAFAKFLKNVMNRIRKHNAPPAEKKAEAPPAPAWELKADAPAMIEVQGVGYSSYEPVRVAKVTRTRVYAEHGAGGKPVAFDRKTGLQTGSGVPGVSMRILPVPAAGVPSGVRIAGEHPVDSAAR